MDVKLLKNIGESNCNADIAKLQLLALQHVIVMQNAAITLQLHVIVMQAPF